MSHSQTATAAVERPGAMNRPWERIALVGLILAMTVGAFAYVGGWFPSSALTPARLIDGFEQVDGRHPGYRRNHARGLGVEGFFESNGRGTEFSRAAVFLPGRVPVLGRFSLGGGQPYAPDRPTDVRGLGLQFSLPNGELWRTSMINLPVFPVRTAEAFYERMLAFKADPKTSKPDPAQVERFNAAHPESVRALSIIMSQPPASGFGNSTFHGLNAFRFTNDSGKVSPVRWILSPAQPYEAIHADDKDQPPHFLFDDVAEQIRRGPLEWRLVLIIGQAGDPTADATIAWPVERQQVDVGKLVLDRVESDDTSVARDINFDPLILPGGIEPSDDPLLSARSAAYSQSFTRRAGETREPAPAQAAH